MSNIKECNEFEKLIEYLKVNKIDFTYKSIFGKNDGIDIPKYENMSVVFHKNSYGFEAGLVEVGAMIFDDAIGCLSCKQVIGIINNYEILKLLNSECNKIISGAITGYQHLAKSIIDIEPYKSGGEFFNEHKR
ncbi:MAG: hypothetical protein RSC28_09660 [Bacteroidales bacterium]